MIFNTSKSETHLTLEDILLQLITGVSLQKVLFAYDFGMEQADSAEPCYPDPLIRFKLLTQTIKRTLPQLLWFSDWMKKTV